MALQEDMLGCKGWEGRTMDMEVAAWVTIKVTEVDADEDEEEVCSYSLDRDSLDSLCR